MKRCAKLLAIMALAGLSVSSLASDVRADKMLKCRMKGSWSKPGAPIDDFEFDATYIAKDGPDTFTGRYVNPGESEADIQGAANRGVWQILLTYRDAKHKGMVKEMTGKGARVPATNLVSIEGKYRTLVAGNDIKADGTFKLIGTCK